MSPSVCWSTPRGASSSPRGRSARSTPATGEFPGGKVEAGETIEAALRRELHEELGITIGAVRPWKTTLHDYPHALVRLHFCKVFDWRGEFEMREAQQMAWQTLPVAVAPLLPGTLPVLAWLADERGFAGATH
jgi:8-oxo-dGTP diphosphatase